MRLYEHEHVIRNPTHEAYIPSPTDLVLLTPHFGNTNYNPQQNMGSNLGPATVLLLLATVNTKICWKAMLVTFLFCNGNKYFKQQQLLFKILFCYFIQFLHIITTSAVHTFPSSSTQLHQFITIEPFVLLAKPHRHRCPDFVWQDVMSSQMFLRFQNTTVTYRLRDSDTKAVDPCSRSCLWGTPVPRQDGLFEYVPSFFAAVHRRAQR
jgi:hypothetical protein